MAPAAEEMRLSASGPRALSAVTPQLWNSFPLEACPAPSGDDRAMLGGLSIEFDLLKLLLVWLRYCITYCT